MKKLILKFLYLLFRKETRSKKYILNSFLILIIQFSSILVSLILVPITLNYLGIDEYGVWITLTTIISWFSFFDIGLGHGLRNKYAESRALGKDDDVKKYVSTTFFVLVFISLSLFAIFTIFVPLLNWSKILNAPLNLEVILNKLAFTIFGMFSLRFILNIVNTLLIADQEPAIPILINFLGNVLSLIVVFIITIVFPSSILYLGIGLTLSQLLPLIISFIICFLGRYKLLMPSIKYFSKKHIKGILSLGLKFFFIQITALVIFQSNNIIIAHTCGLKDVTEFNIAYKYLNILFLLFSAVVAPFWSASTEAFVKNESKWIINSIKRLNQIWFIIIIVGLFMILISPYIYKLWLKETIIPNKLLLVLIYIYFVFLCRSYMYRNFMNGVGKISLQFVVTLIQSIMHIPFSIILGRIWGIYGILIVMILWALLNSIWEPIQFRKIISFKALGIWNK